MHENRAQPESKNHPFWGHRQQVAALVVAHLIIACLVSAAISWPLLPSDFWNQYAALAFLSGLSGVQIGQLALLACWGAFANQPWNLRIPRFLALTAWVLILGFLGTYLVEGDLAKLLVEETLLSSLLMAAPFVVLLVMGAVSGSRFTPGESEPCKISWQFSTRRLLLITAELAILLAIGRIVLPGNPKPSEFWTALTGYRMSETIPLLSGLFILPAAFLAIARQRTWQRHFGLVMFLLITAFGCTWAYLSVLFWPGDLWYWRGELWPIFLSFSSTHLSAAFTILFTFYLLRRIGYDFRRRDDGRLGRSSSNARNSAASASA
jgi:hypothetical protein